MRSNRISGGRYVRVAGIATSSMDMISDVRIDAYAAGDGTMRIGS